MLKFQRDEAARLEEAFIQRLEQGCALAPEEAREECLQAGIEEGAFVGLILLLQVLLKCCGTDK